MNFIYRQREEDPNELRFIREYADHWHISYAEAERILTANNKIVIDPDYIISDDEE